MSSATSFCNSSISLSDIQASRLGGRVVGRPRLYRAPAAVVRGANQNLRTQFNRILRRAGVRAWERLFHNLRASRETELTSEHPLHVVCSWIGNSAIIAAKHYLQVTDDHFAKATGVKAEGIVSEGEKEGGAKSGAIDSDSEAQKAAQHSVVSERTKA